MDITKLNQSNLLRAEDLNGQHCIFTIRAVTFRDLEKTSKKGEKYMKTHIELHFAETDRPFILNKTNTEKLANITNITETDLWIGLKVTLYPTTTQFGDRIVDCIRISAVNGSQTNMGFQHNPVQPQQYGMQQQGGAPMQQNGGYQQQGMQQPQNYGQPGMQNGQAMQQPNQNAQNFQQAQAPQGQIAPQMGQSQGHALPSDNYQLDDEIPF